MFDFCFPTMLLRGICDFNGRVFQGVLGMNRFFHLRGNDSWCFAREGNDQGYTSPVHQQYSGNIQDLMPSYCTISYSISFRGHWGSPIHGLLAVLHVLNPSSGSDVWGNVDTLRGCLAYGLRAASTKLLAPPLLLEEWTLT